MEAATQFERAKEDREMRRAAAFSVITVVLLVLTLVSAQAGTARHFTMTNVGGSGLIPLAAELDGELATLGICAGDSSLEAHRRVGPWWYPIPDSGKFTCTTMGWMTHGDFAPSDGNCPGGFEATIETNIQNHIIRFADGDLMYWVPDEEGEAYLCSYPDGMLTITSDWRIVGGSGRFEGVSGQAHWTAQIDGVPLGQNPMGAAAAHDGAIEGTLVYPK